MWHLDWNVKYGIECESWIGFVQELEYIRVMDGNQAKAILGFVFQEILEYAPGFKSRCKVGI